MPDILIVDDVHTTRLRTELVLSCMEEHTVRAASNGAEGVQMALLHPPDVVIINVALLGMDGFATLNAMRAHGITSGAVAYTSCPDQQPDICRIRRFDAYIPPESKPYQFIATLNWLLSCCRCQKQVAAALAGTHNTVTRSTNAGKPSLVTHTV